MAKDIPEQVVSRVPINACIGKQILDVLTSGMYSDPRMAIREYVQNASDSIDSALNKNLYMVDVPHINISLNGQNRSISVEDNGTGIKHSRVPALLGDLGRSEKLSSEQRGFRGIGRLGGLAYCDLLRFETREAKDQPVGVMEWDGSALRSQLHDAGRKELIDSAIRRTASFHIRPANADRDPPRFFRATMHNVHRFHSDGLMHLKSLREHLSQTLPIPYEDQVFPYAERIRLHLEPLCGFRGYTIKLNGNQLFRPYASQFEPSNKKTDSIRDVELLELTDDNGKVLCRGWYAYSSFLSALAPSLPMRGIRVRQGNMAVGSDEFLRDFFTEPRFASWHIGELHLSSDFILNARRDGFEESANYERFLEWVSVLCRHLSSLCRQSSSRRSVELQIARFSKELDDLFALPFFVDDSHFKLFFEEVTKGIERLATLLSGAAEENRKATLGVYVNKLVSVKENPVFLNDVIDGRTLRQMSGKELVQEICSHILESKSAPRADMMRLVQEVIEPYLKNRTQRKHG